MIMGKAFLNQEMRTGLISGILPHQTEAAGFCFVAVIMDERTGQSKPRPLEAAKKNETNQTVSKNST